MEAERSLQNMASNCQITESHITQHREYIHFRWTI
jgi:hypothetical protein